MKGLIEQTTYLAICIYFEARGESFEGKIAVGHVILNRLRKEKASVKDVIFRTWQFSWANQGAQPPIKDYASFIECQQAALVCCQERMEGKNLFGADHYYNPELASPEWADKMVEVSVIGGHRFMRE